VDLTARDASAPVPEPSRKAATTVVAVLLVTILTATGSVPAQEADEQSEKERLAKIAAQTNNPVGNLWLLFTQNDLSIFKDDITGGNRVLNSFKFQPVAPFLLTEKWRIINRPVFQIQSFEFPELGPNGLQFDRETGLGDTVLLSALSPVNDSEQVLGFGLSSILPTASEPELGLEKWASGPTLVWFSLTSKWVVGFVAQHWWDWAGTDNRGDVSLTDFQYVVRYKVNPFFQVGTGPNIQYDWKTDEAAIPIGMGMDVTTKWGKIPFRWGFDVEYYVERFPGYGAEWNFRLFFIPVIPSAKWATKPIFGK
jgi:hypothetical protein